jgi:hypothetical protein
MLGGISEIYKNIARVSQEKWPRGIISCRWEDNVDMDP